MALVVRELLTRLGVQVDERGLQRYSSGVERAKLASTNLASSSRDLGGGLRRMIGGFAGLVTVGALARSIYRANVEFVQLSGQLETATGGLEAAGTALGFIEQIAKSMPFRLASLTNAFIRLRMAGVKPTENMMAGLGEVATAWGADITDVTEAVANAALGQGRGLKRFGVEAKEESGKMSLTFNGVTTTVERNAEEIGGYLAELGRTRFAGAMSRDMADIDIRVVKLSESWGQFSRTVGKAGFTEALSRLIGQLTTTTTEGESTATALGATLGKAVDVLSTALEFAVKHADALKLLLLGFAAAKITSGLTALVFSIQAIGAAWVVAGAEATVASIAMGGIPILVGLIVAGIFLLIQHWDGVKAAAKSTIDGTIELLRGLWGWIEEVGRKLLWLATLGRKGKAPLQFMSAEDIAAGIGPRVETMERAAAGRVAAPGRGVLGAQQVSNSLSVGAVNVEVRGTTNMRTEQMQRAVRDGTEDALTRQIRGLQLATQGVRGG